MYCAALTFSFDLQYFEEHALSFTVVLAAVLLQQDHLMATVETIASNPFPIAQTSIPSSTPSTTHRTVNIGTRKSLLARVQTDIVVTALKRSWPQNEYVVHAISTMGDKDQVTKLSEFGAKSLWTHELEAMLIQGEVDFIVHSLKDIPTQLPPTLLIGAILPRENPHDALVLHPHLPTSTTLSSLPPFSLIGTSSVRRSAQLKRLHPHLSFASVRGNVGTRLSKLDAPDSPFSGIILAAAGLLRLNLGSRISAILRSSANVEAGGGGGGGHHRTGMLHAVGQGALGIEMREGDSRVEALLRPLKCVRTTLACLAERSLMRTLEGGCSVPIGVETEWGSTTTGRGDEREEEGTHPNQQESDTHPTQPEDDTTPPNPPSSSDSAQPSNTLTMRAIVVSIDGTESAQAELHQLIRTEQEADEFGWQLARALVEKGADRILKAITLNRAIIEEQGDA